MNELAKEINALLLDNETIKEYLKLKEEISKDSNLNELYNRLNLLRKELCKNKGGDSSEYYNLLKIYKSDERVIRYENLQKEIKEYFNDISDILSLK